MRVPGARADGDPLQTFRFLSCCAVVFLGSFLMFQVQPMCSKWLAPAFGGSLLVWGSCMVFFQAVLLAGYAFAHMALRWLPLYLYARIHCLLMLAPLVFLPFAFAVPSPGAGSPLLGVLGALARQVAFPFFLLSTTSVLIQRWWSVSESAVRQRSPYVLYGASNLGSLLGLLGYPLLVEPLQDLRGQAWTWAGLYLLLALLYPLCKPAPTAESGTEAAARPVGFKRAAGWFLLNAASCSAMLAVTNVITMDVAAVPFLWAAPLAIYLLSYVAAFGRRAWYPRWARALLFWATSLAALLYVMMQFRLAAPALVLLGLHLLVLMCICWNCSGVLALTRPRDHSQLTAFYLVMGAGGVCGGLLVTWVAPLCSTTLVEYPLTCLLAVAATACWGLGIRRSPGKVARRAGIPAGTMALSFAAAAACMLLIPFLISRFTEAGERLASVMFAVTGLPLLLLLRWTAARPWTHVAALLAVALLAPQVENIATGGKTLQTLRNYYGIYKVYEKGDLRILKQGTTLHGREYTSGLRAGVPLGYYHATAPAGELLSQRGSQLSTIGMIGLGAGALAAYAGPGQTVRIYELDQDNLGIAERWFTYLRQARQKGARVVFTAGDGRLSLRREPAASLDLLVVDAFSSGSIPVHLLTVEAFREYLRVLPDDGVLLLHVSNRSLDLVPIVSRNALEIGAFACEKDNYVRRDPDADFTVWMAVSRKAAVIEGLCRDLGWTPSLRDSKRLPQPWTDRYSNILAALASCQSGREP